MPEIQKPHGRMVPEIRETFCHEVFMLRSRGQILFAPSHVRGILYFSAAAPSAIHCSTIATPTFKPCAICSTGMPNFDQVCLIIKCFPSFINPSPNVINRELISQCVLSCNKNHITFRQSFKILLDFYIILLTSVSYATQSRIADRPCRFL